jgi:uncharacterized membrane protein YtjA (UPF0391 family)
VRFDTRSAGWTVALPMGYMDRKLSRNPPPSAFGNGLEEPTMLRWALAFLVIALIAAVLGFTGIALAAAGIAKILFFLFAVLFVLALAGHVLRRP